MLASRLMVGPEVALNWLFPHPLLTQVEDLAAELGKARHELERARTEGEGERAAAAAAAAAVRDPLSLHWIPRSPLEPSFFQPGWIPRSNAIVNP